MPAAKEKEKRHQTVQSFPLVGTKEPKEIEGCTQAKKGYDVKDGENKEH